MTDGRRRSRLPNWSVNEEDNEDTRATIGGRRGRNGDRGDGTRILERGCVNIDSSCLEFCLRFADSPPSVAIGNRGITGTEEVNQLLKKSVKGITSECKTINGLQQSL